MKIVFSFYFLSREVNKCRDIKEDTCAVVYLIRDLRSNQDVFS